MLSKTKPQSVEASSKVTDAEHQVLQFAQQKFAGSSYFVLRSVSCSYHEGVLILRGRVPSYYMKQVAQTIVRHIEEGIQIDNRLEVERMS